MNNGLPRIPLPVNEPVRSYAPGSPERESLQKKLAEMRGQQIEVPAFIGGREIRTNHTADIRPPHDLKHLLGISHHVGKAEVDQAINTAVEAQREWSAMHWTQRAAIFLKAADLLAGPWRDTLNAATMLGQSKNPYQAEIDAACEMIDFLRFNAFYMERIYEDQPFSPRGYWNYMQYRPLEGFVFAVTPFNFTSIQGNLPTAPALLGNTVLWKPASSSLYSSYYFYKLMEAAGLPPGVINMIPGKGADVGDPVFASPHFAGLHFTGSTGTFQHMWRTIGEHIASYRGYPRIVGETGGKDFIVAHESADAKAVATAIVLGGFEYQGQKCSAASRCYLPDTLWPQIRDEVQSLLGTLRMGPVEDFSNFINAVIDKKSFDSITSYIDHAKKQEGNEIISGGNYSDEEGYFIEPTIIKVEDPRYRSMCEEIFGPVVSVYVYDGKRYEDILSLVNDTSPYGLTGAIFSQDRKAVSVALEQLEHAAGNFYINDKPTGAVVGQQPFGGGRASGTNDKAGSYLNLVRWVSARSVKETFDPPRTINYPFMRRDS